MRDARAEVPEALEALITRNLSAELADRSPSASAIAAGLEESLTAPATPVYPLLLEHSTAAALERGRDAYRRRAWGEAYARLSAADRETPLEPEDLERLAVTCSMLGRDTESAASMARAYQGFIGRDAPARAARSAFWLVLDLMERRRRRAGQRLDRESATAARPDAGRLCRAGIRAAPRGHGGHGRRRLRAPRWRSASGPPRSATASATRTWCALTRHAQGRILIRAGKIKEGLALLDEAMVAITTDDVTPLVVGGVHSAAWSPAARRSSTGAGPRSGPPR